MLMNYHIGRLVLSSLCVGAFVAAGIWWCSFRRLKPAKLTESAGCVQSFGSVSWSNCWFCLSLVILYILAVSSAFISIGAFPVSTHSASLDVVR